MNLIVNDDVTIRFIKYLEISINQIYFKKLKFLKLFMKADYLNNFDYYLSNREVRQNFGRTSHKQNNGQGEKIQY